MQIVKGGLLKGAAFLGGLFARPQPALRLVVEPPLIAPASSGRERTPEQSPVSALERAPSRSPAIARATEPLLVLPVRLHARILWASLGDLSHVAELDLDDDAPIDLDNPPISRGEIERGIFSHDLQEHYDSLCGEHGLLGLHKERWNYTNGVAEHFRQLTDRKKARHRWTFRDGRDQRAVFFKLPEEIPVLPQEALIYVRRCQHPVAKSNIVPFVEDERRAA